jgi:hypothetical protein
MRLTGVPPMVCGLSCPMPGCSSASMMCESPIFSSAWPIVPSGAGIRITSSALNAAL